MTWRLARQVALGLSAAVTLHAGAAEAATCARTLTADVVVFDQPLMFNRIGAQNVNGTVYALRRDVVNTSTKPPRPLCVDGQTPATDGCGAATPGEVAIRGDKRPRPIVLRVAAGDCLEVKFENLLTPLANPFNAVPAAMQINDQVAERSAGFHVAGMQVVNQVGDDASNVGRNGAGPPGGIVGSGERTTYKVFAEKEGAFLVTNPASPFGGEGTQGASSTGMFGAVNVEPAGARFYRSQVTEEDLRLATVGTAPTGQPLLDYARTYPAKNADGTPSIWVAEGKAALPILSLTRPPLDPGVTLAEIVHSDLNAVIAGPNPDGTFPASTYPLERAGTRNPTLPNRLEAFREFTVIFHDEVAAKQAFPGFFDPGPLRNNPFAHVLHGVRDSFMINYGSGGIGSEIIANRLGVGPMHDCLDCAYEEFFLTSYTVGDPAQLVDVPANAGLETLLPGQTPTAGTTGPKATVALYPDDPSNVHHSYINDFVKFRNLHMGREHHVFHLHNHQWLYNPNDDNANYLDAQGLGPGSGYTYEINFGGSGNRNKSPGDAIFHCHFYPHFAMGMWEHWRVHDVLETGTRLVASGTAPGGFHTDAFALGDSRPAGGARALPDGEILAGTPIPAVVPLPGKAMAPLPGAVKVVPNPNKALASALHALTPGVLVPVGSNALVLERDRNPGYPFWIAGIEHTVGQRPPTPPLDMLTEAEAAALGGSTDPLFQGRTAELVAGAGGHDGGLPRHTLDGVAAGGRAESTVSPIDFSKVMHAAKPVYFPETGTDVERVAMKFHMERTHPSTALMLGASAKSAGFVTNGQPPNPSGVYAEPCVDDAGNKVLKGVQGQFFGAKGLSTLGTPVFGAANPRTYKGANIQIDAEFNKVGWHYPQERIIALWEDVLPTINKQKPPEPFVIRFNTFDCGKYLHTNLVPEVFEVDDYQVRTPTDIIGQHIHLPKWDLSTTDGSGNGWNYEDGTLSPGAVRERIHAINCFNGTGPCEANGVQGPVTVPTLDGRTHLEALPHPFFGGGPVTPQHPEGIWVGARTTIQRWFFDPVVNANGIDRGLGIIFTHDHYGPSTHQQIGLYASVLTEPANSTWVHNETGVALNTRHDGGPTTWQAVIKTGDIDRDGKDDSFREFWYQASDFQHAYEKGVYVGADARGIPNGVPPDPNSFRFTVNPGARAQVNPVLPDLVIWARQCPFGRVRPCPEAISVADPGMFVVNYRNEPVGLRVFDPNAIGPDGKRGAQTFGAAGDLGLALTSRVDRAIAPLNRPLGDTSYPPLTNDIGNGDPFTPIMRAFAGDNVRVKVQMGGHEEELTTSIHGMKWLQGGSGFGKAGNSGWRNAQAHGISEQFTFAVPVTPFVGQPGALADYAYSAQTAIDGWWSGAWGILRTYNGNRNDLVPLPSNPGGPGQVRIANRRDFAGACPVTAPVRTYDVVAALANEILDNPGVAIVPATEAQGQHAGPAPDAAGGTLVYNPRNTALTNGHAGPLHDPTAMMYVLEADLEARDPADPGCIKLDPVTGKPKFDSKLITCPNRLKAGVPVEPLVLRAAAGECVDVNLRSRIPWSKDGQHLVPDLGSYTAVMAIVARDRNDPNGVTTFNNNLIQPSGLVGLHAQLVAFDVIRSNGVNVGRNSSSTATANGVTQYRWYAGDLSYDPGTTRLTATPVEFGGSSLQPADVVKQGQKGLGASLVIVPPGYAWSTDAAQRTSASVGPDGNQDGAPDATEYRDFTLVLQKELNMRYADGEPIENVGAEEVGNVINEDTQDSGNIAINYRTEPLWFRFGLPANAPFGNAPGGFGELDTAHDSFSNVLTGGQDPVTPVFTANAGQPFRLHLGAPSSGFRGSVFTLHGHVWQRDPYYCPKTATGGNDLGIEGKCTTAEVGSRRIGVNPIGFAMGGQDGVHANSHWEFVFPSAGGAFAKPGDYLYRDVAGMGVTNGLWGIVRAQLPGTPAPPAVPSAPPSARR